MILFVVDRSGLQPFSDGLAAWAPEWRDRVRLIEYSQLLTLGTLPFGAVCFMDLLQSSNGRKGLAEESARRLGAAGAPVLMLQAASGQDRPNGLSLDRFLAAPSFPAVLRTTHAYGYRETLPVETEGELRNLAAAAVLEGFEEAHLSVHRVLTARLAHIWRLGAADVLLGAGELSGGLPSSQLRLGRLEIAITGFSSETWWESDASACFWPSANERRRPSISQGTREALAALDPGPGEPVRLNLSQDDVLAAVRATAS